MSDVVSDATLLPEGWEDPADWRRNLDDELRTKIAAAFAQLPPIEIPKSE